MIDKKGRRENDVRHALILVGGLVFVGCNSFDTVGEMLRIELTGAKVSAQPAALGEEKGKQV